MEINQAVILCGGLGTRLRPLTNKLPKPMAPINGVPFLAFLIEQLKDIGMSRILLLTGYMTEKLDAYFGNGGAFGVQISYSPGPVDWLTGKRLWEARHLIDEQFMLMYSDNFVQFNLKKLLRQHVTRDVDVSLVLTAKPNGNIALDDDNAITCYDKSETAPALDYVELGYMCVNKSGFFRFFDGSNTDLSNIQTVMAEQGRMSGLEVRDPYHSISDIPRWKITERYLTMKRIVLLDRDGVLNKKAPKGEYITNWRKFEWLDDNVAGLCQLAERGFQFIVITNQAGINRGMMTQESVNEIHQRMTHELKQKGVTILNTYVCPHHWDECCQCRKPEAGLFFEVSRDYLLRMDRTFYIGDDPRDCIAAYHANVKSIFIGATSSVQQLPDDQMPCKIGTSIDEILGYIDNQYHAWQETYPQIRVEIECFQ